MSRNVSLARFWLGADKQIVLPRKHCGIKALMVLHRPVELAALTGKLKFCFKWTVTRLIRS